MLSNQPHKHHKLHRTLKPSIRQRQPGHFDSETGQIFTETNVASRSRQHSDWIGELKTPSLLKRPPPNEKGARSLAAVATTKTARELRGLAEEHFAAIPWSVSQGIWCEIVESHADSFHIWRTLAVSYPGPSELGLAEHRYHLDIRQPSLLLEFYLAGITSTNSSWLTALRISPKETRIADLVSVAKVSNLGVLDLSDGQVAITSSSFDERVMRTWSELAITGSFQHLRVLLLGWQEHLGKWLFRYLPFFPNLQQVIVSDCPNLHQKNRKDWEATAFEHGWEGRHAKRSAKSLRPYLKEARFPLGAVSGLYYTTLENESAARPMLECWIGTPRKWTHILDDFPGTRTVYFDRARKVVPPPIHPPLSGMTSKRGREQSALSSTPNSPEPKRTLKPKLKMSAAAASDFDDLLAQYKN